MDNDEDEMIEIWNENKKIIKEQQNTIEHLRSCLAESKLTAVTSDYMLQTTPKKSVKSINNKAQSRKQRSELPTFGQECLFEWDNIDVHVGNGSTQKQILHKMNGSIQSGELMAIMGGSGAGKSTLLNLLSGRTNLNAQKVSGSIWINGKILKSSDQSIIKSLCSFVPQSDVLCSSQTVYEALLFYSKLKLSNRCLRQQIKRVNYLIKMLHLENCRNNIIGDMNESSSKKGISGGERRRVCIASEIINDVDIIFLDEPTSGLDSFTAAATIKTLKEFCTVSNKIIIATIHQPSMEVFYLFDKLVLLSHGKCCFSGDMKTMEIFFKDAMRPKTNPADTILFEIQKEADKYAKKWKESPLNASFEETLDIDTVHETRCRRYTHDDAKHASNNLNTAALYIQIYLLLQREFQSLYRDQKVSLVRLGQILFFALVTGIIYFDVAQNFSDESESFFFLSFVPMLIGMVSLLVVFPQQKALFQREYNSNTYSIVSFAVSFILIEIPRELIHMAMFNAIVLAMIGLDGDWLYYLATLFLCSFTGGSFGMLFGVISNNSTEAAQMIPASLVPLIMFSDFLIEISSMPVFIQWIADVNPLYYLFRCFMIIEFEDAAYDPLVSEIENCEAHILAARYLNECATNVTSSDYFDAMSTTVVDEYGLDVCNEKVEGITVLNEKHINPSDLMWNWLRIIVICVVVRIIAIMLLYANNNNTLSWLANQLKKTICFCRSLSTIYANKKEKIETVIYLQTTIPVWRQPNVDVAQCSSEDIDEKLDDSKVLHFRNSSIVSTHL